MTAVSRTGDSPFAQWQLVDATFGTPNEDLQIGHRLTAADPRDVNWIVVRKTCELTVYESDRENWRRGLIVLRATAAGQVQLLLNVIEEGSAV